MTTVADYRSPGRARAPFRRALPFLTFISQSRRTRRGGTRSSVVDAVTLLPRDARRQELHMTLRNTSGHPCGPIHFRRDDVQSLHARAHRRDDRYPPQTAAGSLHVSR